MKAQRARSVKKNNTSLIISDTHFPYQHPDTFEWLKWIKKTYKPSPDLIYHSGDLVDNHSASYHEIEYGTMSAQEEYLAACKDIQTLSKIFKGGIKTIIGNHGGLNQRKAKTAGIPLDLLKGYNEAYKCPKNWIWADHFKIPLKNMGGEALLVHSVSTSTLNNAARSSLPTVQGHHHGTSAIEYYADTNSLRWSMTVGCLVDNKHPAFNYASQAVLKKPIISVGLIIDGMHPVIVPMAMDDNGRWIKQD